MISTHHNDNQKERTDETRREKKEKKKIQLERSRKRRTSLKRRDTIVYTIISTTSTQSFKVFFTLNKQGKKEAHK